MQFQILMDQFLMLSKKCLPVLVSDLLVSISNIDNFNQKFKGLSIDLQQIQRLYTVNFSFVTDFNCFPVHWHDIIQFRNKHKVFE